MEENTANLWLEMFEAKAIFEHDEIQARNLVQLMASATNTPVQEYASKKVEQVLNNKLPVMQEEDEGAEEAQ
jgi:hypothetical protein